MQHGDQASFVCQTELDAHLLITSGMVEWELYNTRLSVIRDYHPRYSENMIVHGFFISSASMCRTMPRWPGFSHHTSNAKY
jgi:hypothetical protein